MEIPMDGIFALLALLLLAGALVWTAWYYRRRAAEAEARVTGLETQRQRAVDALTSRDGSQRATIKGQLAEQLAPILPGFPYTPSDFRFLGQPIDFVVFDGLTEAKEGLGDIREVVIGDIKMGGAKLSPHQRMIKRAVEEGRVRWVTLHVDPEFRLKER
jgi:predicted Holliday junction resolvase-like endonuclease